MEERTERRILDKAGYIVDAVDVLAAKRDNLTFEEYTANREDRDVVEREFETAIEAAIDIATMLLRATDRDVPETNAATFYELAREGILEEATAERMARAAGFRNILAHRYGNEIDDEDVFNALQTELPVFREYLEQVRDAL